MPKFTSKAAATDDKLRGGYYTPDPIARYVANWVAMAGARRLEPSCGDGAVLVHLADAESVVTAIELQPDEAAKASLRTGTEVIAGDFFDWLTIDKYGAFDGVAGNPPYIRFGNWDESLRMRAMRLLSDEGFKLNKLTNAWVPFVVGSVRATREGGRIGLVLPAELLQVGYASQLRSYLIDQCSEITLVSFTGLVFPGILQEVVLFLAERGPGPARMRTAEVKDADDLAQLEMSHGPASRALLHDSEKWTKYYLEPAAIAAVREMRMEGKLAPLGNFAQVDVGVVTGRNSFFVLTRDAADRTGILHSTVPIVARSVQVPGLRYGDANLQELETSGARTRLLYPELDKTSWNSGVADYIAAGEFDGVHSGYKCRIRRNWWRVPSVWRPDAFMLRQISTHPRIIANGTGATSTDTVHRVRTLPGVNAEALALASFNSISFALAEVLGRSYGGGILELEPSEAEALLVVDPSVIDMSAVTKVDHLLKEGRLEDALQLADQAVLIDRLGFSQDEVLVFRGIWRRLQGRRAARGRPAKVNEELRPADVQVVPGLTPAPSATRR